VKQCVPARPGPQPEYSRDINVAQLKQLVELQMEIVRLAKENEQAKKRRKTIHRKLAGGSRRFLAFLSQLW
jgi:hypothetical protein